MPRAPISNQRKLEIVKLWLIERLTYEKISERTGVSIGRISEVINEFKRTAKTLSLEEAVRIYGVKDEVELLLDLSSDLRRAGITVSEAKEGAQLLKKLQELGVKRDDLEGWIKLCQKISPSSYPINDFISASIELSKLENETGLSFRELLADYRNKIAERDKILKEIACYNVLAKYYASIIIDTTDKTLKEALEELLKCLQVRGEPEFQGDDSKSAKTRDEEESPIATSPEGIRRRTY